MPTMLTKEQRKIVREHIGRVGNSIPILVVPGSSAPHYTGESWHYETMSGNRINHPSAYSKRGWSNMRYCPSTLAIEVGASWCGLHIVEMCEYACDRAGDEFPREAIPEFAYAGG